MYGTALRRLLEGSELTVCPGVHDPLTAAVAGEIGFDALYVTGYGTSLTTTGYPDAGLATLSETVENAMRVQERVSVPVITDADTGYGNATNVIRTVREYVRAGVGAIHLEDQTTPKRCGHVKGKRVIDREEAVGKVRAAVDARDERDGDLLLIARTDARGAVDGSLTEAIERANAYYEAGADVAFVEGPTDEVEVERVGREVDAPLLYNCPGANGTSPYVPPERLTEWGYDLLIYPLAATLSTIVGTYETLRRLDEEGQAALADLDESFAALPIGTLHEFAGFPEVVEWERAYMPEAESEKYEESVGIDPDRE